MADYEDDDELDEEAQDAAFQAHVDAAVDRHVKTFCLEELTRVTSRRDFQTAVVSSMLCSFPKV